MSLFIGLLVIPIVRKTREAVFASSLLSVEEKEKAYQALRKMEDVREDAYRECIEMYGDADSLTYAFRWSKTDEREEFWAKLHATLRTEEDTKNAK